MNISQAKQAIEQVFKSNSISEKEQAWITQTIKWLDQGYIRVAEKNHGKYLGFENNKSAITGVLF